MLTVFIPTAGLGTRLELLTKNNNKSLITINKKPVISHIIENFDLKRTKFIIALGYKADFVKQYLEVTYPLLKFMHILMQGLYIDLTYL